jgi:hypothetical protein
VHRADDRGAARAAHEAYGGGDGRVAEFSRSRGPIGRGGRVLAVACLFAAAALAWAHPDAMLVDGRLTIEPGAAATFPASVHFHRLVARYDVVAPAAASLQLELVPFAEGSSRVLVAPLEGSGRLHHLIDCCLEADFSGYDLVVRNDGPAPATLDLRAWVVHDEFAVVALGAEPGALEVPLALFLGLGVAAVVVAGRRRLQGRGGTGRQRGGRRALLWSQGLFAAAVFVAVALAFAGMVRTGAGPVGGMVAIMADLPVPGGPFGSRMASVMGVLLLAWVGAVVAWVVAVARGARSVPVTALGLALATVHLGGGVALGMTYGAYAVPIGLGIALALPLVASVAMLGPATPAVRRAQPET